MSYICGLSHRLDGLGWSNRSIPAPHQVVPFEASFKISHPTIAPSCFTAAIIASIAHTAKTKHTQTKQSDQTLDEKDDEYLN